MVKRLAERGDEVTVLDDLSTGHADAVRDAGVGKIVFSSSAAVYGNKLAMERMLAECCAAYGLSAAVLKAKPENLLPCYALLVAALLVNAFVPMNAFLSLPALERTLASCTVVFLPVAFAGIIFAAAFSKSRQPDVDFASNVAGIILGGLSEQLSLVTGFNYLILVAIGYYLLSLVTSPRALRKAA